MSSSSVRLNIPASGAPPATLFHRRPSSRGNGLRFAAGMAGVGAAAVVAYWFIVMPWHVRWGATEAEVQMRLPGDELVANPKNISTRAISIRASATAIWPWLVQMGQEKGGLYSYEVLENLAGCNIHNADRIVPDWQSAKPGDLVRLGPEGYPVYTIAAMQPNRALILQAANPQTGQPVTALTPTADNPALSSWTFYLAEQSDGTTRLIIRSRGDYVPGAAGDFLWSTVNAMQFVMERGMLLGIRDRVEATH